MLRAGLLAMTLVIAACADISPPLADPSSSSTNPTLSTSPSTSIPPTTGCEGGVDDYVDAGPIAIVGQASSDAAQISSLTVFEVGVCERFEVALVTEGGAPATSAPRTTAEIFPDSGLVRLRFTGGVTSTAVTESLIESTLVRQAYVVRGLDGSMFVDLHLSESVGARAVELRSPARVAVELRPGGEPVQLGASLGANVVVTDPARRTVEYPILVRGYSRTFEANVMARLSADGSAIDEYFTTAADWTQTWGEFVFEIPTGPGGVLSLFIGEESAEDGTIRGVTLDLSAG